MGDPSYVPPEIIDRQIHADEKMRRYAFDMYHLGSLVVFFFTQVHLNALLLKALRTLIEPQSSSSVVQDILPYYQAAFGAALSEFSEQLPAQYRSDLTAIVTQLCNPDPLRRGHPDNKRGSWTESSLERYISWFNLLAYKAEVRMLRGSVV